VFQQEAATYLLELKRFVACIEGNASLRRCAEDAVTEKNRRFEPLTKRDADVRSDLVALRRAAQKRFPLLAENADRSLLAKPFATWTLATFDNIAGGHDSLVGFANEFEDASPTGLMVQALQAALFGFLSEKGVSDSDPHLRDLKQGFRDLRRRRREIHQEELNLERGDAGAIWQKLRSDVLAMNPSWDSFEAHWLDGTDGKGVGKDTSRMHGLLYGRGPVDDKDRAWFSEYRAKRNRDLKALNLDFHLRLGMRASVGGILQRYARRCCRLRLRQMTELLKNSRVKGNRELVLTRDAAIFVFDQGFEVLVEQPVGIRRVDMIGMPIYDRPLLVEAKIYDRKRPGLAAVADGLTQIHQYANDLADQGVHVDPVLLVFRLGGPRATPVSEYQIGNLRVTIAHVDLGESADSGSNAPRGGPDITADDITAALERKGRRPGGKPTRRRRSG
jgi:hypothetical protein